MCIATTYETLTSLLTVLCIVISDRSGVTTAPIRAGHANAGIQKPINVVKTIKIDGA